jgi:uncharacterized protein
VIAALLLAAASAGFTIPPTPDHFVTDNAGALSDSAHASIENELQAYEKATGHQIIVWIGQSTGDVPLETYTGETADRWKVGRKGHDDGAVLFLFMRDRKIRIEVGYGLESKLTDADAQRIIDDDITPKMREGDPDAAVSAGVADMLTTAEPSYKLANLQAAPAASGSGSQGETSPLVIALFAAIFIIIGLYFAVTIVLNVVGVLRYGYLIVREGPEKAKRDMARSRFFTTTGIVTSTGAFAGGGFGSSGGGGDFSSGGGSFGGGGASGGW